MVLRKLAERVTAWRRWILSVLWAAFAFLFAALGCAHWSDAKIEIPPFELTERPFANYGSAEVLGADVDQLIKDFAADFNSYLKVQNESSRTSNERAACGYFLASATAFVSMCLVWLPGSDRREVADEAPPAAEHTPHSEVAQRSPGSPNG